ncbi:Abscisic acid-insensitive 5-like protein 1 [Heracleum sosnowskyi]|uniref:Abscisic acid-insensitive 5-like protein 1 n=1 Tax=Heracleum sosnowskyi TaxID=360622 RepID=A0AAD8I0G1_9APIA|nr:Abscisic acid-insensitive 5-like protein 1 [Heracleum sosnowskyi]
MYNSDIISQGDVESFDQSTNQQHPDSHELPPLNRQLSICSINIDEVQHIFSGDFESFGSMNIDELFDNILTAEEIQVYEQKLDPDLNIALSTSVPAATATVPTAAATANVDPQFPEGEIITSTVNGIDIQHSLLRPGSLTYPSPLSQKTVDELWYEMHKLQQEQENGSTANVQEVDSSQRQTTNKEMTLEDFLLLAGVVQAHDRPSSPLLQQSCVSYQNKNNTALGSVPPGSMVRPLMASGEGGDVPAYQARPERSVKDAASIAGGRMPGGNQPLEVLYGGKMQNITGGGGCRQGSPAAPVSSDSVGSNPVEKVAARKQRHMIKHRESAARSRARRQAHTRDLEAELNMIKEENARLQQALEGLNRVNQQYMEELMKAHKAKDGKKGLKRSRSCLY